MTPVRTSIQPVTFTKVKIDDGFWAPRIKINREQTLPVEYAQCRDTGRIAAANLNWKEGQPNKPHIFFDSDVAKWIEAASYSLSTHPDQELERQIDEVIELYAKAQRADGYLNTYYNQIEKDKRWTNLRDNHELYCAGHLIEAAVAHFQATGKKTFLDVMCRFADHIATIFGRGPEQKRGYCGHEEIELALVKLYRATGEQKYFDLAQYFIDERGQQPHYYDEEARARGDDPKKFWATDYSYNQAHKPVRELREIGGHAVRAMYLYCGMADAAAETGDEKMREALDALWAHGTERLMYVTGGLGSSRHNEGFTFDYDLPNETAYCETCAAIGFVFWAQRMLHLECDSRYADVLERALYNNVLSGVSLDGKKFFYENPLASLGSHRRQEWFGCACCPPNVARILASLGQYVYSQGDDEAIVHLYVQGSGELSVGGQQVTLQQTTEYPWNGRVAIRVSPQSPSQFALKLRIPAWAEKHSISVNGKAVQAPVERGYAVIERTWSSNDRVELDLAMEVQRVRSHPKVRMNAGRIALQRGPLVYCLEGADNGADLNAISLPRDATFRVRHEPGLLNGVSVLTTHAVKADAKEWGIDLYQARAKNLTPVEITAIPYCVWENRGACEMLVWNPEL
jgi:DUF1680 family protein